MLPAAPSGRRQSASVAADGPVVVVVVGVVVVVVVVVDVDVRASDIADSREERVETMLICLIRRLACGRLNLDLVWRQRFARISMENQEKDSVTQCAWMP